MCTSSRKIFFFLISLILLSELIFNFPLAQAANSETIDFNKIKSLLRDIRQDNATMYNDLKFFVSLGSRVTGTEQADRAAEYIANSFRSFSPNMQVFFHYFNDTICVDYGSSFELLEYPNEKFQIYAMKPNLVVPVTCNFTAPIVYVPGEKMADFNGVPINGSIVLMEFNTQYRWLEAAMLGAKAVIFIEPDFCFIEEYQTKYVNVPFKFPRFYMTKSDGEKLKNLILREGNDGSLHAHISSNQKWEIRTGKNVVAIFPGTTDKIYAITAYYDSYSIVPSMSPGANEALGVVALLEAARLFTRPEYKPYYTLMFIAYSGHHQMLSGARALWNDFYFGANRSIGERVVQTVHLQLPTDSEPTRLVVTSILTKVWSHERVLRKLGGGVFRGAIDRMINNLNAINHALGTHYKLFPAPHADEAPFNNWGWMLFKFGGFADMKTWAHNFDDNEVVIRLFTRPGLSIRAIEFYYFWSPIDTIEKVNWNFFLTEVETVIPLLYVDSVSEDLPDYWRGFPQLTRLAEMSGRVGYYNVEADNYTLVPKGNTVLVYVEAGLDSDSQRLSQFRKVVKADANGKWSIKGVFAGYRTIKAYAIDDETGDLTYAPDLGMHKYPFAKPYFDQQRIDLGWQVVFKCSSVVLFDLINPLDLEACSDISLQIVEFKSGATPEFYGYDVWLSPAFSYTLATAYFPPNREVVAIFKIKHLGDYPIGVLLNTSEVETGRGFIFDAGTQNCFSLTPLHFSRGLLAASAEALAKLEKEISMAKGLREKYLFLLGFINTIKEEIANHNYSEAYLHSLEAWAEAQVLYSEIRNTTLDIINSVPFFAFILTPFSIIFASLLLSSDGLKRILTIAVTFIIFYLILYFVHPGFAVTSNPLMLVIGIMILILILPVLGIVFLTFESSMMKIARRVKGVHMAEISRSSAVLLSVGIGIQNIRRYRVRSILMLITIILTIFAITAFSSASSIQTAIAVNSGIKPIYPGVSPATENYVKLRVAELLTDKTVRLSVVTKFYVGLATKDLEKPCWFWITYKDKKYPFYAMMGLRPDEKLKPYLNSFLVKGEWFSENSHWQAILPDTAAEALGITELPVQVKMENVTFTVIGIINSTKWDSQMRNMDGSPMLIPDLSTPGRFSSSSELFIIPYSDSLTCWSGIQFFALMFQNASQPETVAKQLFSAFKGVDLLYSAPDMSTSFRLSPGQTIVLFGWQYQVVPILISAFIILNNMLGSVYERKKEISIYASVGLSPLHIGAMFLAEALVYAIVGSTLGYTFSSIILKTVPLLISISSNYGGGFVVTAIMVTMLITISSVIYPMFLAAKLVTPSLERAWKPPTKPVLDDWTIPLPFLLEEGEVNGFISYLHEFLFQHTMEDAPLFSVGGLKHTEGKVDGRPAKELRMKMRLAPYTQGIIQDFRLILFKDPKTGKWSSLIRMHRIAGKRSTWVNLSRVAVDQIRKQFLMWRSLPPSERTRYIKKRTDK